MVPVTPIAMSFPPDSEQSRWFAEGVQPHEPALRACLRRRFPDAEDVIALLSLSGLQCGWAGTQHPDNGPECMKMTVNIYVYAMTR